MAKLLRLQCEQLGLDCEPSQAHHCQPLVESLTLLSKLPNTSEDDLARIMQALLDDEDLEVGRVAVRSLLLEAIHKNDAITLI